MTRKPGTYSLSTGFTLAELLVAAAIASLAILIMVGVLRKGIEISDTTQHRQRARAIIDSCFESSTYQVGNFVNIPASYSASVIIDPRSSGSGDDLTGSLSITVSDSMNTTPQNPTGTSQRDDVALKHIVITVSWTEQQGPESISLKKSVTNLDF